jgi:hypothetical protein
MRLCDLFPFSIVTSLCRSSLDVADQPEKWPDE